MPERDPAARDEALRQLDSELDALRRQRKPVRNWSSWFDDNGPADILLEVARMLLQRALVAFVITLVVILLISESCVGP